MAQVHRHRPLVVVAEGVVDFRPVDPEEGHAAATHAAHLDAEQLAATDQAQGAEKDVFRLDHESGSW